MRKIGSQTRESIEETKYSISQRINSQEVILRDETTGELSLWCANDHYAGYVIEIDEIGYEFCTSIRAEAIEKILE